MVAQLPKSEKTDARLASPLSFPFSEGFSEGAVMSDRDGRCGVCVPAVGSTAFAAVSFDLKSENPLWPCVETVLQKPSVTSKLLRVYCIIICRVNRGGV